MLHGFQSQLEVQPAIKDTEECVSFLYKTENILALKHEMPEAKWCTSYRMLTCGSVSIILYNKENSYSEKIVEFL